MRSTSVVVILALAVIMTGEALAQRPYYVYTGRPVYYTVYGPHRHVGSYHPVPSRVVRPAQAYPIRPSVRFPLNATTTARPLEANSTANTATTPVSLDSSTTPSLFNSATSNLTATTSVGLATTVTELITLNATSATTEPAVTETPLASTSESVATNATIA